MTKYKSIPLNSTYIEAGGEYAEIGKMIERLWYKHSKAMYVINENKEDFYSLCDLIIAENIKKYDKAKCNSLINFLAMVINNKVNTYIRDQNRGKRVNKVRRLDENRQPVLDKCGNQMYKTIYDISIYLKSNDDSYEIELEDNNDLYKRFDGEDYKSCLIDELMCVIKNKKEKQFMQLIIQGCSYDDICNQLYCDKTYIHNTLKSMSLRPSIIRAINICKGD